MNICLPIFELSTPLSLQFLDLLDFGCKPRIIHYGFLQDSFWARRKWITPWISQPVGLSIMRHITHTVETRTNSRWPFMWWFTRQWVVWRYLTCADSPHFYINCLK
jgi:hypothetical protein